MLISSIDARPLDCILPKAVAIVPSFSASPRATSPNCFSVPGKASAVVPKANNVLEASAKSVIASGVCAASFFKLSVKVSAASALPNIVVKAVWYCSMLAL